MSESRQLRSGTIARLNKVGTGYLTTEDHGASKTEFAFPFSKIMKVRGSDLIPYRGESARELGLTEGTPVTFTETDEGYIESVQVNDAARS